MPRVNRFTRGISARWQPGDWVIVT